LVKGVTLTEPLAHTIPEPDSTDLVLQALGVTSGCVDEPAEEMVSTCVGVTVHEVKGAKLEVFAGNGLEVRCRGRTGRGRHVQIGYVYLGRRCGSIEARSISKISLIAAKVLLIEEPTTSGHYLPPKRSGSSPISCMGLIPCCGCWNPPSTWGGPT
jgi:hypothetical protein